jgi:Skp family chaperone for outer membrane proteins
MRFAILLCSIFMLATMATPFARAAQTDVERVTQEVAQAEAAVKLAAERKALWTSAGEALALAKKYLADGKVSEAAAPAALAKELAELGISQTTYPLFSE